MRNRSRWITAAAAGAVLAPFALSDVTVVGDKGPSTASTPYVVPTAPGARTVSILTVGESVSPKLDGVTPYRMIGIPDGLGAYDNGDGTFTLLVNHELGSGSGTVRAHGTVGATVSAWRIDRESLRVISGGDLIRDTMVWDFALQKWNATPSAINRFCSADLPPVSAYYNSATGKGTLDRLFMNGEENGGGRAFAHVASGPQAGVSYEFARMGRDAWENISACPFEQDRTVVIGNDDTSTPGGQVYVYLGTKSATGNQVQRAGLANGTLYAVKANGIRFEDRLTGVGITKGSSAPFTLLTLGDASAAGFNAEVLADAAGATEFLRPEDGAWDPSNPSDFYFVTTDRFDQTKNGSGTQVGRSRLYRLRFGDITFPEGGGTITLLLDGTEPHNMLDNLCVSRTGFVLLQEDVGGNPWSGKIWRYEIATGDFDLVAHHDVARFGDETHAPAAPFSNDEESSGIIDVADILGTGWFLADVQAHYNIGDAELVEGGQLYAFFDPATAAAPVFEVAPSANPSEAMVGQTVTYSTEASLPGNGTLNYSWTFGDGGSGTGAVATHAFGAPCTYTATCTAASAETGLSVQGTVDVLVTSPSAGCSLVVDLDFARSGKDSLAFDGMLRIPSGCDVAGRTVSVDIGGVERSFVLDSSGNGNTSDGAIHVIVTKNGNSVPAQIAKFTVALQNTSLQASLADDGLVNADVSGALVRVPVRVTFRGETNASVEELMYSAKAGKSGSAK
jgi:hypothetical protein